MHCEELKVANLYIAIPIYDVNRRKVKDPFAGKGRTRCLGAKCDYLSLEVMNGAFRWFWFCCCWLFCFCFLLIAWILLLMLRLLFFFLLLLFLLILLQLLLFVILIFFVVCGCWCCCWCRCYLHLCTFYFCATACYYSTRAFVFSSIVVGARSCVTDAFDAAVVVNVSLCISCLLLLYSCFNFFWCCCCWYCMSCSHCCCYFCFYRCCYCC